MNIINYKMLKTELKKILGEAKEFASGKELIGADIRERFSAYFSDKKEGLCEEDVISDESLFRDYSRLGDRKVNFSRVRNPFNLSKFCISSYEKTWYIKTGDDLQGPFNSYEMDDLFKKEKIKKSSKISINSTEFFRFDYFIEIVYPLPRIKNPGVTFNKFDQVFYLNGKTKFTQLQKDIPPSTNKKSTTKKSETPFKRTPFKNVPEDVVKPSENFVVVKYGAWSTSKKNNKTSVKIVGETLLLKSRSKNTTSFLPQTSKNNYKLEMNDMIGNYTAIKRDQDQRKYVDLSKKIDFQDEEGKDQEPDEGEEIDFDNIEVTEDN